MNTLTRESRDIVFLLDEFPILVFEAAKRDLDGCRKMLNWFRSWRLRTAETGVRFLVTGSIGLDNVVRRHGLGPSVNDFDSISLLPLEQDEAVAFVLKLAGDNDVPISQRGAVEIIRLLGRPWPYFLQIFMAELQEVNERRKSSKKTFTKKELSETYWDGLVAGRRDKHSPHMWSRLKETFDPLELKLSQAILRETASGDRGVTRDRVREIVSEMVKDEPGSAEDVAMHLLNVLTHDGYLHQERDGEPRFVFFTHILRDYWKRNHT